MKKHLKTFFQGSVISLISAGIIGLLNLRIRLGLARYLTLEEYGYFYSSLAIIMPLLAYSDLGLNQVCTMETAKANAEQDFNKLNGSFSDILQVKFFLSIVFFLSLLVFSPLIMKYYLRSDNVLTFCLLSSLLLFYSLDTLYGSVLIGLKKFLVANCITCGKILLTAALIFIFLPGRGVDTAAVAYCVAGILFLIISVWAVKKILNIKADIFKKRKINVDLLKLGSWVAISTVLITSMCHLDSVMLTSLKGVKSTANYNLALPIMQIIQMLMIFPVVFLPISTEMWKEKRYSNLKKIIIYAFVLSILLLIPVFFFFKLFGGHIVVLLFPKLGFKELGTTVTTLCMGMVFFGLSEYCNKAWELTVNTKAILINSLISGLINLVLNIILIPIYGYTFAAITTMVSFIIYFILCYTGAKKILIWKLRPIIYIRIIGSALAFGILLIIVKGFIEFNTIVLIISIIGSIIIYGVLLLLTGELTEEVKMLRIFLKNK